MYDEHPVLYIYNIQGVRFVSNYIMYRSLSADGVYCAWSSRSVLDKQERLRLLDPFVVVHPLGMSVGIVFFVVSCY
jgi:hypothetical protein